LEAAALVPPGEWVFTSIPHSRSNLRHLWPPASVLLTMTLLLHHLTVDCGVVSHLTDFSYPRNHSVVFSCWLIWLVLHPLNSQPSSMSMKASIYLFVRRVWPNCHICWYQLNTPLLSAVWLQSLCVLISNLLVMCWLLMSLLIKLRNVHGSISCKTSSPWISHEWMQRIVINGEDEPLWMTPHLRDSQPEGDRD